MANVFISYTREDAPIAARLREMLQADGHTVFSDQDALVAGANFSTQIANELANAQTVVVLLSHNSKRGKWVEEELRKALEKGRRVIPVLLDQDATNNWVWPLISDRPAIRVESPAEIDEVAREITRSVAQSQEWEQQIADIADKLRQELGKAGQTLRQLEGEQANLDSLRRNMGAMERIIQRFNYLVPMEHYGSIEQSSDELQAVKSVIEAVGRDNVVSALRKFGLTPRFKLYQNWRQGGNAEEWEEAITSVEGKEGSLYLLMKGFQAITVPTEQYEYQLKQFQNSGDWRADIIDSSMEHKKKRLAAFLEQVKTYEFRHIMPEGALQWYLDQRFHSPDAWAYHWNGTPAKYEHIAAHIHEVITLLKTYDNYKIGLMEDRPFVEVELYDKVQWEVKVGHAVLLENFITGAEQDILILEPKVVAAFARFYEELWSNRRYVNTDKGYVIGKLEESAKTADERSREEKRTLASS